MNKLNEMLASAAGRYALMDAIPLLFVVNDGGEEARLEHVPLDRIAWSAAHRLNRLPEDVVDYLQNPVELNRVVIKGEALYLAQGGNHRIERFVEAGRKTIPAKVCDWSLAPASLKKGVTTEYRLDGRKRAGLSVANDDLTLVQAEVLKALELVKDETVLAPTPPRKRRFFGLGD